MIKVVTPSNPMASSRRISGAVLNRPDPVIDLIAAESISLRVQAIRIIEKHVLLGFVPLVEV
ncbi:MAG: hypothetical protein M3Q29_24475 [Chloroflexota bacterium]|nr:hypothetical protein [Chloroflexota bacterium]